jgi:lipopolysaccharide export LptBFGC system permease protein LptF
MKFNANWLKKINKTKAVVKFLTAHFMFCAAMILTLSLLASLLTFYIYAWKTPTIQEGSQTAIQKDVYEGLMKKYQDKQAEKEKQLQTEYRDIFK